MTEDIHKRRRKIKIIVYGGFFSIIALGILLIAISSNVYFDGIAQVTKDPTRQYYAKKAIDYEKKNLNGYYPNANVMLDSIDEYSLTREQLREQVPACRSIPLDHFNKMYDAAYKYQFRLFYEMGANDFWDGILSLGHNDVITSYPRIPGCALYEIGV